jgi:cytochrome P450
MNDTERQNLDANDSTSPRDFFSRFQDGQKKSPNIITPAQVIGLTAANVFAGSDSTAITLRSVFYFLLRNPTKMERLLEELRSLDRGPASTPVLPAWADVHDLPYLSAVVKETLRCFPAVGLSLERIVPAGSTIICEHFLPPGTIVGCNAWTVHQDEEMFGDSTHLFIPERWLDVPKDEAKSMNAAMLSFGAGPRSCIGKNISLLEIYKAVPALLLSFEVSSFPVFI